MSVAFDTVSGALDEVVADDLTSIDRLFGLMRDGFTSSPRMSVAANEFVELLPRIRDAIDLFDLVQISEAVERNRLQPVLAMWIYRHHHEADMIRLERIENSVEWKAGHRTLYTLKDLAARLDLVSFDPSYVMLDFNITPLESFTGVDITVGVEVGTTFVELSDRGEESGHYLWSREIDQSPTFQATVDLGAHPTALAVIVIRVSIGGDTFRVPLRTRLRPAARVTAVRFQRVYRHGVEFRASRTGLAWRPATLFRRVVLELLYTANMAKRSFARNGARTAAQLVALRAIYWLTRQFLATRKIWMMHDKMYSAADSGEYMFHYLAEHTHVTPVYAVNADSRDVPRLRAEGVNIAFPRTLKHLLAYLNADVMLETHSNPASYNRFNGAIGFYLRDLVRFRIVCIQHGLNVQDIHRTMHRTRAGIERMYCASRAELVNSLATRAGYRDDQVVLAGFARLDGQWGAHSREILIAPTWRPETAGKSVGLSKMRKATPQFTDSLFFMMYSEILCNQSLLETARRRDMKIRFVLHPILASNIGQFRAGVAERLAEFGIPPQLTDDTLIISAAGMDISFNDAIKQAAMLVTDYSGVQFDVAYPGKPVVYLHSPQLPHQYDYGAMDYSTMAFGPLCETPSEVVSELIRLIERDARIDDFYLKRIEDFFEIRDDQNCKRIAADIYQFVYGKPIKLRQIKK